MKKLLTVILLAVSLVGYSQTDNNLRKFVPNTDSTMWISPSYSMDFFSYEPQTGKYRMGLSVGIGYGLRYKPKMMKENYLCALDFYLQGYASDEIDTHAGLDYFNIQVLPVFSVFNWFGIGYGITQKIGLEGQPSITRTVFSFGLRKEI